MWNNIIKTILRYNKSGQSSSYCQKETELIFLFRAGLSHLISKLSLISRIYLFMMYDVHMSRWKTHQRMGYYYNLEDGHELHSVLMA